MPDIGATLREARMRARIDISELEQETKIRAKYLRALENEEWDLLPGPTYVKSFLREYADALGLDGKLLVEEYKMRRERPSDFDQQPISPRRVADERRPSRGPGRGWVVVLVVAALIGALYLIGSSGGDSGSDTGGPAPPVSKHARHKAKRKVRRATRPVSSKVRLTLRATAPVYVCLQAGKKVLVPARTLTAGQKAGPFRAKHFTITLGNSNVLMRVNGHQLTVPPSAQPIGYIVDRKGRRPLAATLRPTCGA